MEHTDPPLAERISALADGLLYGEAFASTVRAVCSDPKALQDWHAYHVVGDVLRNDAGAALPGGIDFLRQFEERLRLEPSGLRELQDGAQPVADLRQTGGASGIVQRAPSANAQVFRWKLLAGVACMGLAGVIGLGFWNQSDSNDHLQSAAVLSRPLETSSGDESVVMLRDPVLDGLMAEHQRLGGYSALQIPTGFLRNATYRAPAR